MVCGCEKGRRLGASRRRALPPTMSRAQRGTEICSHVKLSETLVTGRPSLPSLGRIMQKLLTWRHRLAYFSRGLVRRNRSLIVDRIKIPIHSSWGLQALTYSWMSVIFCWHTYTSFVGIMPGIPGIPTGIGRNPFKSEELRGAIPKALLAAAEMVEDGSKIRDMFIQISGYHKLEEQLQWIKDVDANNTWSRHWFISVWPGSTKLIFLSALMLGPERSRQSITDILTHASTILALILSATLGLLLSPPDFPDTTELAEMDKAWVPYVYNYSLALSVGASIGFIVMTFYISVIMNMIIRDADWLRIVFNYGDCFTASYLFFFLFSLNSGLPAIIAVWAPTVVSVDNHWGRVAIFIICLPSVLLPLIPLLTMDTVGSLQGYYLRLGSKRGDTPDMDCVIENFEKKIEVAKIIRQLDSELQAVRSGNAVNLPTSPGSVRGV